MTRIFTTATFWSYRSTVAVLGAALLVYVFTAATAVQAQEDAAEAEALLSLPDPDSPGVEAWTSEVPAPLATDVIGSPIVGTNVRAAGGPGTGTQAELSMASSGSSIVIVFNGGPAGSGFVTSVDGGSTFSANASPPVPAGANPCCDPGVVSDLLGNFYFLQLFRDDGAGNCTNSLHVSTDGGQNFSNIVGSPFSYASGTTDFPDQPHIGIDRVNTVAGQPQLYVFTRHFTSGINCPQTGGGGQIQGEVTCSTDGGATWAAATVLNPFTDKAHWAVGWDGSVYLVGEGRTSAAAGTCQANGVCSNGQYGNCIDPNTALPNDARCNLRNILLRRSTADCNTGLSFGSPATVVTNLTFSGVGIDREFAQPYVVVDQNDPSIAYVAWSADRLTGVPDRDVLVARCSFTGTTGTCDAPVRVSDNPVGDGTAQYFPMTCMSPDNVLNVSWNDQRAGANSTAIYHTEIATDGGILGAGSSFLTSEVNFTPVNFGGTPDYGDYNENNDACDIDHFYAAWVSHVSPPGIVPASNDPDIFFAVIHNIPDIRVDALAALDVCAGASALEDFDVFNVGDATLTVTNVSRVSGSSDITVEPAPALPLTISPDAHVTFSVRCTPTSSGTKTATIRVASDDPDEPTIDVVATCEGLEPNIVSLIADAGSFGDVCREDFKDLDLTLSNSGGCDLTVSDITSSSTEFQVATVMSYPVVIGAGDSLAVPIRLAPTSLGPKSATLTIMSDDPDTPVKQVAVAGDVPPGDVRVTGSTDFGDVCAEELAEKTVSVCNVGPCNLNVASVTIDCADFTLINNPFPAAVSPDSCQDVVIRFTPTSAGPKSCTLTITSDDPDMSVVQRTVTGATPIPSIDVPPDQAFPPTVIQDVGACRSLRPFPVSNTGQCDLHITNLAITTNADEYSLMGLPSFPIVLEPGHVAGEGDLRTVFEPDVLDRDRLGALQVTYLSDPITGTTATVGRDLCGEGVSTGVRVLATIGGVPIPTGDVFKLQLQRVTGNRKRRGLISIDVLKNPPLQTVTPAAPCLPFQFHGEFGTVDTPVQLLPGFYNVTVTARVNGKRKKKTAGFDLLTCDFNRNVVIDF